MNSETEIKSGNELVESLVMATGLPDDLVQSEIKEIIETAGHAKEDLTLDQLRQAMLLYLESLQEEFLKSEKVRSLND